MPRITPQPKPALLTGFRFHRSCAGGEDRSRLGTDIELRLGETGAATLLVGGFEQRLPARRLAVYWQGTPHLTLAPTSADHVRLTVPLAWLLNRRLPARLIVELLEGQVVFEPDGDHFDCDLQQFTQWASDLGSGNLPRGRALELELEARLWRLADCVVEHRAPLHRPAIEGKSAAVRARRIAAFIAENHTRPITAGIIGKHCGLNPAYLITLFSRQFGRTPLENLQQHRLSHALRFLVTTHEPVSRVARLSGFGSVRRLNAVFREHFDDTPLGFRKRHPWDGRR